MLDNCLLCKRFHGLQNWPQSLRVQPKWSSQQGNDPFTYVWQPVGHRRRGQVTLSLWKHTIERCLAITELGESMMVRQSNLSVSKPEAQEKSNRNQANFGACALLPSGTNKHSPTTGGGGRSNHTCCLPIEPLPCRVCGFSPLERDLNWLDGARLPKTRSSFRQTFVQVQHCLE